LDLDALTAATGLDWLPDHTTASDTRCVYDPVPGNGESFLTVTVEPRPIGPGAGNDAAVCEAGTSVPAGDTGFVCLLPEGGVFAALTHDDRLVTVAAARVPAGTTAERLVGALAEQLGQPS
ncbi:MAG: hypothetical protein L0H64_22315, partial [Pseudonocardia sp.]|nr:hypothetical protein [Pseudonocardia sp.]